jgi:hypothetical protein
MRNYLLIKETQRLQMWVRNNAIIDASVDGKWGMNTASAKSRYTAFRAVVTS